VLTNAEIAAVFSELAERTAVVESQPYRYMAYNRAARAIADSPVSVARLAEEGRTREIPGIGQAIAEKIDDYMKTGTFRALDRVRAEVPDGLLALTRVAGIGRQTALKVWASLGAASWGDVAEAARTGALAELPGVGPKTAHAVLEAASADTAPASAATDSTAEASAGGMLRSQAAQLGAAVGEVLEKALGARLAGWLPAGELVRGVELPQAATVLLVCADGELPHDTLAAAANVLCAHGFGDPDGGGGVPEPLADDGVPYALLRAASGAPVELWASGHADGLALATLHAVGPPAHAAVVSRSLDAETAAPRVVGEALPVGADPYDGEPLPDFACYDALGLPYVPPELRDRPDAFQAAEALSGALIRRSDFRADLHCHTAWSDGLASVLEMARAAHDRGDTHISIADHSAPYAMVNGLDSERLEQQAREIALANSELGGEFTVLQGSEVEIQPDGSLGLPDEVLARLDWVVASLHVSQRQDAAKIKARMEGVLRNPLVDCIGHPTSRLLRKRPRTALDVEWLIEVAAETGTALEINCDPRRLDLDSAQARLALEAGVLLTVNTDAHRTSTLALRDHGVALARRAGATPTQVVNTFDPAQLQDVRPRNRA